MNTPSSHWPFASWVGIVVCVGIIIGVGGMLVGGLKSQQTAKQAQADRSVSQSSDQSPLEARVAIELDHLDASLEEILASVDIAPKAPFHEASSQTIGAGAAETVEHPLDFTLAAFPSQKGSLLKPADGITMAIFQDGKSHLLFGKGIAVKTTDYAPVIAPFDGMVVFAEPFRRYGQMIIIEHPPTASVQSRPKQTAYSVLAGLERVSVGPQTPVQTGEPLGQMGSAHTGRQILYYELRIKGRPIDPRPWFAAQPKQEG